MRIDRFRRRRGSITIEALMIVPFAIVMVLVSRFILEAMLNRHEIAVYTRGSTVAAALTNSTAPGACDFTRTPFAERIAVSQTASVACRDRDGETGLTRTRPFFEAIRTGAQPARWLIADVDQRRAAPDVIGAGEGSMSFDRPAFLASHDATGATRTVLAVRPEVYPHHDAPWQAAHDPAIWQELAREGTEALFPNVFPAR